MSFYKRTVTLPAMYEHVKPDARILDFAQNRIDDIKREIATAHLEMEMWKRVIGLVEPHQCQKCGGTGEVSYIDDPMDGARFKTCPSCKGSGKP